MADNSGQAAESKARQFLSDQGLMWLHSNFRCKRGELDLVMLDGQSLVFIEVRARSNGRFASASQSVDWRKQKRLTLAAGVFLKQFPQHQCRPCRFDVIAYDGNPQDWGQPRWIRQAFEPAII